MKRKRKKKEPGIRQFVYIGANPTMEKWNIYYAGKGCFWLIKYFFFCVRFRLKQFGGARVGGWLVILFSFFLLLLLLL